MMLVASTYIEKTATAPVLGHVVAQDELDAEDTGQGPLHGGGALDAVGVGGWKVDGLVSRWM